MTNSNKKKKKINTEPPDNPERASGGPTTRQKTHSRESEQTTSDRDDKDSANNLNEESPMPKMGLTTDKGKARAIIFETEPEPEEPLKYSHVMEMMSSIANKLRKDTERHEQMLREELQTLRFDHNRLSEISQAAWDSTNGWLNIRINTNEMETSIDSNSNPEARITEQLAITNVTSTSNTAKDPEPMLKGPPVPAKDLFTEPTTHIWWHRVVEVLYYSVSLLDYC